MHLRTAYDSVILKVAYVPNLARGVHQAIAPPLYPGWQAPRTCVVQGQRPDPFWLISGLPQGNPCAGNTSISVLIPWHGSLKHNTHNALNLAFIDDRSLQGSDSSIVDAALHHTTLFDAAVSIYGHTAKRQVGDRNSATPVEHLCLLANFGTAPSPSPAELDGTKLAPSSPSSAISWDAHQPVNCWPMPM